MKGSFPLPSSFNIFIADATILAFSESGFFILHIFDNGGHLFAHSLLINIVKMWLKHK